MLDFLKREDKLKKYKTQDLNIFVKLLSITAFLDKQIKSIEIIETKMLLAAYIKKNSKVATTAEQKALQDYCNTLYIENVKKYQENPDIFELEKQEVLNYLKTHDDKNYLKDVETIVLSDNETTFEEKLFLQEVKDCIDE